ncbi:MAG: HYExAFE family protein [Sedimentisphaerales bacterium]|nr:HYExAFE family protein [Sedimentisphaerales bacterium]
MKPMAMLSGNHYERAFQAWLKDNGVQYLTVDQQKRAAFARNKIKSFDFIFYSPDAQAWLAEVKGRKFSGKTFTAFGSLPNWVTVDDINGLNNWVEIFGKRYQGLFIFAYDLENIDVDTDGREIFEFDHKRYVFIAVRLSDYQRGQTRRSEKWETVHLSADFYKSCALDPDELICKRIRT